MPIYFSCFITALLLVSGDPNNHNLPQSGRLFILRVMAIFRQLPDRPSATDGTTLTSGLRLNLSEFPLPAVPIRFSGWQNAKSRNPSRQKPSGTPRLRA